MSNQVRLILIGLLVAIAFGKQYIPTDWIPGPGPEPTPVVDVEIAEPDAANKGVTAKVREYTFEPEDQKLFVEYYATLAQIVNDDAGVIKTTRSFYEYHKTSLTLLTAGTDLRQKYVLDGGVDGLGVHVDKAIENAMGGLDNVSLDETKKKALVDVLNALAWSFQNAG